ncbi:MAG: lactate utilization protein [Hyphomicrobiales bacterium]|nr:lactate utilization protein [Hyphomicrobiales bacterium]
MNARDEILGRLRRNARRDGAQEPAARLAAHPRGTVPARSALDHDGRVALFMAEAGRVDATVARLNGTAAIPAAVARYLEDAGLAPALRTAPHPLLAGLDWAGAGLDARPGASDGHDVAGLNVAIAGVAETGTLVLASGPETPTTLNFLPDADLVVLREADIVGAYEDVWDRLRAAGEDAGFMPRNINWVTGPSRTADIEQTLLLGAHGPRSLHILLVRDDG